MLATLLLLPPIAAALCLAKVPDRARLWILRAAAFAHLALTFAFWLRSAGGPSESYLSLDAVGLLVLSPTSALFAGVSVYLGGYLARAERRSHRIFIAALLLLEGALTLAAASQHLGLFWVALETATLASAPLLYFHHTGRALEATWKYLIVGSVGIALALLGTVFLAIAATSPSGESTLFLRDLTAAGAHLSRPWLHAAFVLLLMGYGTKMGLAPMHAWKPDAYGEAPPPVAGLLAGTMTNCAFLGVLRATQICAHAGEAKFASSLLILLGLVSLAVAAVFIVGQADYRRLLAYASVEQMGVLVFGLGFGALGAQGALLHVLNNALNKGILFLAAGNLLQLYGTSAIAGVAGALRRTPATGALLMIGLFAAVGLPPFGLFVSEFMILRAALAGGAPAWPAALYLALLALIFLGMCAAVLPMAQGAGDGQKGAIREPASTLWPPFAFAAAALALGVYVPRPLAQAIESAARQLGGG
jgi:hydrogenase-4 component F